MEGVNEVSLDLKHGLRISNRNNLAAGGESTSINKQTPISTEIDEKNRKTDNNQQTNHNIEQFNPESTLVSFVANKSITINDQQTTNIPENN